MKTVIKPCWIVLALVFASVLALADDDFASGSGMRIPSWNINVGTSGERQRQVIASRSPQEEVPEFSSIVPYPDIDQSYIWEQMSDLHRSYTDFSMELGIPVNAAFLLSNGRRLTDYESSRRSEKKGLEKSRPLLHTLCRKN